MTAKTKTETMFSLVGHWKFSDTTQQLFCSEYDMKVGTFAYWVAKHNQPEKNIQDVVGRVDTY